MSSRRIVSVIAASSQSGAQAVRDLASLFGSSVTVRACFRTEARANELLSSLPATSASSVEKVVGIDAANPATLPACFAGATAAIIVTPHDTTKPMFQGDDVMSNNMVSAAVDAGVKHIVYVGSWTAPVAHKVKLIGGRFKPTEDLLDRLGREGKVSFTSLRSGYFHENYAHGFKATIKSSSSIFWPAEVTFPSVDPRDMGSVAASIAAGDYEKYNGKYLQISGPEKLGGADLARVLGKHLGTEIAWKPVPIRDVLAKLPKFLAEAYDAYLENPENVPLSSAVQDVTGKPARSFDEWLNDHVHLFK